MKNKEIKEQIIGAFKNSEFKWRTSRGISKDTKIPIQNVIDFLEHSELIIKAKKANNKGQPLYSFKEIYETKTPFTTRLLNAITNKINE